MNIPPDAELIYESEMGFCYYSREEERYYWCPINTPTEWTMSCYKLSEVMRAEERCIEFWERFVDIHDEPRVVRVKGYHYIIGHEDSDIGFRGFGGIEWFIRFNDGRVVRTTNLWGNGEIPPPYLTKLPDNAVFMDAVQVKLWKAEQAAVNAAAEKEES